MCWKCDPINRRTAFDVTAENLPAMPISMPTVTLYREQLQSFRNSLEYMNSIITALVGREQWSRLDIAAWFAKNGTDEMKERLNEELQGDLEFLYCMAQLAAQDD